MIMNKKGLFLPVFEINQNNFKEEGIFLESLEPEDESEAYVKKLSAKLFIRIETSEVVERMAWYFGPNHYPTLKDQNIGLQKIIPLGWGIFGWVNKGLVIPIFNWLNNYFSNYGLIILLLTLIIKLGLFFPMYKVYKSSAKMRILKPEVDPKEIILASDGGQKYNNLSYGGVCASPSEVIFEIAGRVPESNSDSSLRAEAYGAHILATVQTLYQEYHNKRQNVKKSERREKDV